MKTQRRGAVVASVYALAVFAGLLAPPVGTAAAEGACAVVFDDTTGYGAQAVASDTKSSLLGVTSPDDLNKVHGPGSVASIDGRRGTGSVRGVAFRPDPGGGTPLARLSFRPMTSVGCKPSRLTLDLSYSLKMTGRMRLAVFLFEGVSGCAPDSEFFNNGQGTLQLDLENTECPSGYTESVRLQLDFKAMADATYDTIDFKVNINKLTISSAT